MERYILIALIIIGFWLVGFLVYLAISGRQRNIEAEIDEVSTMLDAAESGNGAD